MTLLYALLFLLPALAFGQTVNLKPYNLTATALFVATDTDLSGDISKAELDASFRGYDTDRNGRISRQEYTNYVDEHTPSLHALHDALFDLYDVDNDHILDKHDFDHFYGLMDGNGDGHVSHFEFVRYWSILFEDLEHLHVDV